MSTNIYLYVKIHNITGLKYLGKTTKKDPHKYRGSGKLWTRHIKKHGYDVTTKILFVSTDIVEFERVALHYSYIYNIVESDEWANLCEENEKGGSLKGELNGMYGKTHGPEIRKLISKTNKGRFKNKSYEEIYGKEKAVELRKKRSDFFKTLDNSGSNNSRYDKSNYIFYNTKTQEEYIGTRYDFQHKFDLLKSGVHKLIHQRNYVYRDWILKASQI